MKRNMGTADKRLRIFVALIIAGLYFADIITGTLGIVLMVVAAVFLLTSLLNFCPL